MQAETQTETRRYGFFLVEGFALMSAASAVEPLRAANLLSGAALYDLRFLSRDGGPVRASCGAIFETDPIAVGPVPDLVFVIAGGNPFAFEDRGVLGWLRRLSAEGVPLGGISGGAAVLAQAGVMQNRRFTVHWEHFDALRARSDDFLMERRLFVIDRDRYTCAGGVAPLDLMHALIRSDHGAQLATQVSDWYIHTGIRDADAPQRSDGAAPDELHRAVASALALMEAHLADPLSMEQLAQLTGLSPRSLQRQFGADIGQPLMRHYMIRRLEKADELLRQTRLPVGEVALATGFVSQAHFAKSYRAQFGGSPRDRRAQLGLRHLSG
ncbi:GlxA family transcriptional regulator [Tritonibacter sp. SIMBA_163]|uniref:GlxA family transcriptional regulator n=1 Tax=Tritonibacter sp. SIMBA_163 TaxID=3080868 RepID=UPI00397F9116